MTYIEDNQPAAPARAPRQGVNDYEGRIHKRLCRNIGKMSRTERVQIFATVAEHLEPEDIANALKLTLLSRDAQKVKGLL